MCNVTAVCALACQLKPEYIQLPMVDIKAARKGRAFTKTGKHSKSKKGKDVPVINVAWPVLAPSAVFNSLVEAQQLHRLTGAQCDCEYRDFP